MRSVSVCLWMCMCVCVCVCMTECDIARERERERERERGVNCSSLPLRRVLHLRANGLRHLPRLCLFRTGTNFFILPCFESCSNSLPARVSLETLGHNSSILSIFAFSSLSFQYRLTFVQALAQISPNEVIAGICFSLIFSFLGLASGFLDVLGVGVRGSSL